MASGLEDPVEHGRPQLVEPTFRARTRSDDAVGVGPLVGPVQDRPGCSLRDPAGDRAVVPGSHARTAGDTRLGILPQAAAAVDILEQAERASVATLGDEAERGMLARLGEIEHLPVADNSADIIMSNCVINLSPDKQSVYKDAFRALKPGGRLAISDILATRELPDEVKNDLALHSACVGGAATVESTVIMLEQAGFRDIIIDVKEESKKIKESK